MTTSFGRHKPVRAYVKPVASHQKQGINGTVTGQDDRALLSTSLTKKVLGFRSRSQRADGASSEPLYVSIEWAVDRRLGVAGSRSLVVAVEERDSRVDDNAVHLPAGLIPAFFDATLPVLVSVHTPIPFTLLVLQPISSKDGEDDSVPGGIEQLALKRLCGDDQYSNGSKQPIARLGSTFVLPMKNSDSSFHVLLAEPVAQGVVTPSTRIIISSEPYHVPEAGEDDDISETSFSRSLSAALDEFDPDAFLSSTLQIPKHQSGSSDIPSEHGGQNGFNGHGQTAGEEYLSTSISSSEGSLTPRPGSSTERGLVSPVAQPTLLGDDADIEDESPQGVKFRAIAAMGPGPSVTDEQVVWVGVGGLGRAGIFEGDWVVLRSAAAQAGRLAKVLVWEYLDEEAVDIPSNPLLIPPELHRALFPITDGSAPEVYISPTPFGARTPSLPIAKTITLARIATTEGIDRRYEASWLKGLKRHFSPRQPRRSDAGPRSVADETTGAKLLRRGDIIALPVSASAKSAPPAGPQDGEAGHSDSSDSASESDSEEGCRLVPRTGGGRRKYPTSIAYFIVTSLSFEPLVPVEEDFRSSWSSKARAGELGCWIDVEGDGPSAGSTKMVLVGQEQGRMANRSLERSWHQLSKAPEPFSISATTKLRDLLGAAFSPVGIMHSLQLSILVKGAKGGGKTSLVQYLADQLGFSVVTVECYDIIGDTSAHLSGSLTAAAEKAVSAAPSILLLKHVEAVSQKNEAPNAANKASPAVKALEDVVQVLNGNRSGADDHGATDRWPSVLIGLTEGELEAGLAGLFKQEVELPAPNERERLHIIEQCLGGIDLAPDVSLKEVATQSAALHAGDIRALLRRARDITIRDAVSSAQTPSSPASAKLPNGHGQKARSATSPLAVRDLLQAGLPLTAASITSALAEARSAYSDAIGAPKIPNVRWEDVGGLEAVKREILETVQLPLERPDLFADGLKKRSGILLYGPPGTGKTLLAKAVATTCSLNFFSVKGPELLNMYIGESEANVRRIFQRARDASPCVIFMDELDSVAPKRGQQGDSGGVMDRIVSQLLAELDGMSGGSSSGGEGTAPPPQVFVMGATNRPDLLDPALLRPGRFDRLIYLSPPTTHTAQADVLRALTRKIELEDGLDMDDVAEGCGLNLTGADLYAVVADAVMRAMSRKAEAVEARIAELERERTASEAIGSIPRGYTMDGDGSGAAETAFDWPKPLTPNYYLSRMAKPEETRVQVSADDFARAVFNLRPSVSEAEMAHYERVQREFRSGA